MLASLLVAVPPVAISQGSTSVRRIGYLDMYTPDPHESDPLWTGLRDIGWQEGKNLRVERRYAESLEALYPLAEELVRGKVEVIVTGGPNQTLAAMRATATIPIVFRRAHDPVFSGLVASLARPGGNVTGFSHNGPEVVAKCLELLKDLVPAIQRIGALENPTNPGYRPLRGGLEDRCRSLGLKPVFVEVASTAELDRAMAELARVGGQGLVVRTDRFMVDHRSEIVSVALRYRLPTIADTTLYVQVGALASYFSQPLEGDSRTASLVDRILRGAKPADLPVEQPTKFWLALNIKTARELGIKIPESVMVRVDEVIR